MRGRDLYQKYTTLLPAAEKPKRSKRKTHSARLTDWQAPPSSQGRLGTASWLCCSESHREGLSQKIHILGPLNC